MITCMAHDDDEVNMSLMFKHFLSIYYNESVNVIYKQLINSQGNIKY